MSYAVTYRPAVARDLKALQKPEQKRIAATIDALQEDPRPAASKMLEGPERLMCLRVGVFRIVYEVRDEERVVRVIRVAHRREVYRR